MTIETEIKVNEFLPAIPKEGYRGFYPVTEDEWHKLPLPMRCSTWDSRVAGVIFDVWFDNYKIKGYAELHPQNVFKALYMKSNCLNDHSVLLYSVVYVRWHDGSKSFAKWYQDTETGAFTITTISNDTLGTQGGFRGHVPANCRKEDGKWGLHSNSVEPNKVTHFD